MEEFWLAPPMEPYIVTKTPSYLILYKPPRMHTVPLRPGEGGTLLAWIAARYPEVLRIKGRKEIEGGLVHRLDYETHGLVLCARTDDVMNMLLDKQKKGEIVKDYEAVCRKETNAALPGFPPLPAGFAMHEPTVIESAFRPFGRGRAAVRPIPAENTGHKPGELYRTEIISYTEIGDKCFFKLRIRKGFRHQIRCHLAWIGRPIVNDPVYVKEGRELSAPGFLALRATGIVFNKNIF